MKSNFKLILILVMLIFNLAFKSKTSMIVMQRTPCYGTCPWYSLTIESNGRVTYKGIKFVEKIGVYEAWAPKSERIKIFKAFESEKYRNWADSYEQQISDMPSINLEFTYGKKIKKVTHAEAGVPNIQELAKLVDSTLFQLNFKKIGDVEQK